MLGEPLADMTGTGENPAKDLAANTLPAYAFVTPNLIDDTHDASVATSDKWLAKNLRIIFNSAAYMAGSAGPW